MREKLFGKDDDSRKISSYVFGNRGILQAMSVMERADLFLLRKQGYRVSPGHECGGETFSDHHLLQREAEKDIAEGARAGEET